MKIIICKKRRQLEPPLRETSPIHNRITIVCGICLVIILVALQFPKADQTNYQRFCFSHSFTQVNL